MSTNSIFSNFQFFRQFDFKPTKWWTPPEEKSAEVTICLWLPIRLINGFNLVLNLALPLSTVSFTAILPIFSVNNLLVDRFRHFSTIFRVSVPIDVTFSTPNQVQRCCNRHWCWSHGPLQVWWSTAPPYVALWTQGHQSWFKAPSGPVSILSRIWPVSMANAKAPSSA